MYFIEKAEDLVGKTVAFINAAQFADAITIATADGGIMIIAQDENQEVQTYKTPRIQRFLFENYNSTKYVLPKLQELGIIKENEYEELKEARRLKREEADRQRVIQKEKNERAEFARLKEKYEGIGPTFALNEESITKILRESWGVKSVDSNDLPELTDPEFTKICSACNRPYSSLHPLCPYGCS